jgi:hypothetical protein
MFTLVRVHRQGESILRPARTLRIMRRKKRWHCTNPRAVLVTLMLAHDALAILLALNSPEVKAGSCTNFPARYPSSPLDH